MLPKQSVSFFNSLCPYSPRNKYFPYQFCTPMCGSARIRCPDCGEERLVLFFCKTHGFCPSSGGQMSLISFIEEPKAIDRIIASLKLTIEAEWPPPQHNVQQLCDTSGEEENGLEHSICFHNTGREGRSYLPGLYNMYTKCLEPQGYYEKVYKEKLRDFFFVEGYTFPDTDISFFEVTLEFLECGEFSLLNLLHSRFDSFPSSSLILTLSISSFIDLRMNSLIFPVLLYPFSLQIASKALYSSSGSCRVMLFS